VRVYCFWWGNRGDDGPAYIIQNIAVRMEATRDGQLFHRAQCPLALGDYAGIRGLLFLGGGQQRPTEPAATTSQAAKEERSKLDLAVRL
jgi:hypothetical protein